MPENSCVETVFAYQDAWTNRDFERAASFLAENVFFQSGQQHLEGREAFIGMLSGFAQRIQPRWVKLMTTQNGDDVLILYNLFTPNGTAAACADYFKLKDGKIVSETLVFDPKPFQP